MAKPDEARRAKNLAELVGQRDHWTDDVRNEVARQMLGLLAAYVPVGDWKRCVRRAMDSATNSTIYDQIAAAEAEARAVSMLDAVPIETNHTGQPAGPPAGLPECGYCDLPSCPDCGRGTMPGWQGSTGHQDDGGHRSVCAAPTDDGRPCTLDRGHRQANGTDHRHDREVDP